MSVSRAVESLNNMFDLTASLANLKPSQRKTKNKDNTDNWYDKDCKNLRTRLNVSIESKFPLFGLAFLYSISITYVFNIQ